MGANRYLWLQTIGGGSGDQIDASAIPPEKLAAACTAIEAARVRGQAPLWSRPGHTLVVTVDGRKLLATINSGDVPLVTIGVAPRDRDGAKLWPLMVTAAEEQGLTVRMTRPREPWALVIAYPGMIKAYRADDAAWLPLLEAEIACAWLGIVEEVRRSG